MLVILDLVSQVDPRMGKVDYQILPGAVFLINIHCIWQETGSRTTGIGIWQLKVTAYFQVLENKCAPLPIHMLKLYTLLRRHLEVGFGGRCGWNA